MMRSVLASFALLGLLAPIVVGYEGDLSYVDGILSLTSTCLVQGIKLDGEPPVGIDWPDAHGEAHYGALELGDDRHAVMVDRSGGRVDLYIDADRSGVLVPIEWEWMRTDGTLLVSVPLETGFDDGTTAPYRLIVMWNLLMPTVLTYCRDTYREGAIDLRGRTYALAIVDEDSDARYDRLEGGALLIDADGDGALLATSDSHERFRLEEPFNLDGTVYRVASVARDGSRVVIEESDEDVPPKPVLLVGFHAPGFEAVDAVGEAVSLEALRGSVVVLDFWAGWCAPCIAEFPTLQAIAADLGVDGVVVLGVNVDRSLAEFEEAMAEHGIGYRQIYDGVEGPINALYRIEGIPMTYVIDREGVIRGRGLRGEELQDAVEDLVAGGAEEEGESGGAAP